MGIDQHKRQRKLERKAAKRRAALMEKRVGAGYTTGLPNREQLEAAAQAPIYKCFVPSGLFHLGIGNVVFSRRLGSGGIAAAFFLVDVSCLGVKDAFLASMPRNEFELRKIKLTEREPVIERSPAYVRKLVEDAVAYAAAIGVYPHPDYALAKQIFGKVDAGECHDIFTFGQNGKPHFVAGPNDTPAKCQRIMATLRQRLGADGFHFTIPVDPDDLDGTEFLGEED